MGRVNSFKSMETQHVICRALQHSWTITACEVETYRGHRVYVLILVCSNCDGIRRDRINLKGELETRSYVYPAGYLVAERPRWGDGSTFKTNVRKELMKRLMEEGV